jgi:hypothetical protein
VDENQGIRAVCVRLGSFLDTSVLPSTDELHNFQPGSRRQSSFGPFRLFKDAAVQFHGHAGGVEAQLVQESEHRLAFLSGAGFAVYYDFDIHARLTPLFCNHYSQI